MQKGFASILTLIVLLVILASAGAYFYYPQIISKLLPLISNISILKSSVNAVPVKIDTTSWKTYKDEFAEFKYPDNWKVLKEIPKEFTYSSEDHENRDEWKGGHMLTDCNNKFILQNPNQETTLITLNCNLGTEGGMGGYERVFTINDNKLKIFVEKWKMGLRDSSGLQLIPWYQDLIEKYQFISDFNNVKNYKFILAHKEGKDSTAEPVFDQILNSFKYLKTYKPITSITRWKTFKSDKYGFSFEYPTEWGDMQNEKIKKGTMPNSGVTNLSLELNFANRSQIDAFYLDGFEDGCSGNDVKSKINTDNSFSLSPM